MDYKELKVGMHVDLTRSVSDYDRTERTTIEGTVVHVAPYVCTIQAKNYKVSISKRDVEQGIVCRKGERAYMPPAYRPKAPYVGKKKVEGIYTKIARYQTQGMTDHDIYVMLKPNYLPRTIAQAYGCMGMILPPKEVRDFV